MPPLADSRSDPQPLIAEFDRFIRRDPGRRGLLRNDDAHAPLCAGHLEGAARDLAARTGRVLIVTGFYIPRGSPPAAETDGPPGAVLLAWSLGKAGYDPLLVTDAPCASAVCAAARAAGLPRERVTWPDDVSSVDAFIADLLRTPPVHVIAIERAGPSHTVDSVAKQLRHEPAEAAARVVAEFAQLVPVEHQNCCHNMRGTIIDAEMAPLHSLFEILPRIAPGARTIGIGDGGNEIGMGSLTWSELRARLDGYAPPCLPCRIPTDWTIVGGVSNWGAAALAAATLLLRNQHSLLAEWDARRERLVIDHMLAEGPAVDGVTGRREATVDGLPFLTYIQPWVGIRHLLGQET